MFSRSWLCLTAATAAMLPAALAQQAGSTPLPNIRQLMLEVSEHQKQLEKVRENYTYTSLETTEDVDADGKVKKTETEEDDNFFVNGHLIARTVARDGKPLAGHDLDKENQWVYTVHMISEPTAYKISAEARRLLDRDGPSGVTMRKIANGIGITPMALYRHYPNREGLLNALADAGFAELTEQLEHLRLGGGVEHRIEKILDVFLDYAFAHPRLFELMFLAEREGARRYPDDFRARRSPTANLFAEVLEQAMKIGRLRKDNVWEIVLEIGALMQGLTLLYLAGRIAMSPSEFRALCHRSFRRHLHGILV